MFSLLSNPALISSVVESSIVTNGLTSFLDAYNPKSWAALSSSYYWKNLATGGNNGALHAFISTYPSFNGNFLTTTQSAYVSNFCSDYRLGVSTIMYAGRYYSGSNRGRLLTSTSPPTTNWLLGTYSSQTTCFYNNHAFVSSGGPNDMNWRIYTATCDVPNNNYRFYVNGTFASSSTAAGGQGPSTDLQIGNGNGGGGQEPADGQVSFLLAYNRLLSDAEILQNYNAMRGRVGL